MRKKLSFCLLLNFCFQVRDCLALQTHPLIDHHKLELSISAHELNRIALVGDRILHVVGAEGSFDVQSDDDTGQIFVRCLKEAKNKPGVLTIITESGLTQDLKLIPNSREFQSILLRPQAVPNTLEEAVPAKPAYLQQLTHLIRAMTSGHRMHGYTLAALKEADRTYPEPLTLTPLVIYRSEEREGENFLEGRVYRLKNDGAMPLPLNEQVLVLPSDSALALTKHTLKSQEEAFLFVISKVGRSA